MVKRTNKVETEMTTSGVEKTVGAMKQTLEMWQTDRCEKYALGGDA